MACENGSSCIEFGVFGGSVVGLLDVDSFLLQVQAKLQAGGDPTWRHVYEEFPSALADGTPGNLLCPIVSANTLASSLKKGITDRETECDLSNLKVLWREQRYGKPETLSSHCAMNEIVNVLLNYKQQKGYSFFVERGEGSQVYIDLTKDTNERLKEAMLLKKSLYFDSMYLEKGKHSHNSQKIHSHYIHSKKTCKCLARLIYGAFIMNELSCELLRQTSFSASCGVATNKLLAWFARNSHKPNGVTILTGKGFTQRLGLNFRIDEIPFIPSSAVAELKLHFKTPLIIIIKRLMDNKKDKRLEELLGTKHFLEVQRVCEDAWKEPVKDQPYVPSMTKTLKVGQPVSFFGSYFEVKNLLTLLVKEILEFLVEERRACLRVTESLQITFSTSEVNLLEFYNGFEGCTSKFAIVSVPLPLNLSYQHESSDEDAGRIVDGILIEMSFRNNETLNAQISSITATAPAFVDLISQPTTF